MALAVQTIEYHWATAMKIYFKEPSLCTSGYEPILINYKLVKRQKKTHRLTFNYFDNVAGKSKFIKNAFDKLIEISGMKDPDEWENKRYEEMERSGYVYFIRNGNERQVKIGWAQNPQDRKKQLQTGNPNKLRVIAIKPCPDKGVEYFLHHKFKKERIDSHSEWFFLSNRLKKYIQDLPNVLLQEGN